MPRTSDRKADRPADLPAERPNDVREEIAYLKQKFSSLSIRGHYKECFRLIEDNLSLLYLKDRWPEGFYSVLKIHRRCYPSTNNAQPYDQYLEELLRRNGIPAVFVSLLRNQGDLKWSADCFRDRAIEAREQKDHTTALDYADLMIKMDPVGSGGYLLRGWILEDLGRLDDAAKTYEHAIELNGKNYQASRSLAELYEKQDPKKALAYIERALELSPNEPDFYAAKSGILDRLGDLPGALETIETARSLDLLNPDYLYRKGDLLLKDNQQLRAMRQFTQAISQNANHLPSLNRLARLLATDQPELALPYATSAAALQPEKPGSGLLRAHILLRLDQTDEAERQFLDVLAVEQNCAPAHAGLGGIYLKNQPRRALQHFSTAVTLENSNAQYHLGKGQAHQALQQREEAIDDFKASVTLDDKTAPAWAGLGELHVETQPATAADYLKRAIALDPENSRYHLTRGEAFLRLPDKLAEATECFNQAVLYDPANPELHLRLALLLEQIGNSASAVEHFRTATELDPKLAEAHHGLARMQCASEPEAALEHINIALRLQPTNDVLYNLKARILIRLATRREELAPMEQTLRAQAMTAVFQLITVLQQALRQNIAHTGNTDYAQDLAEHRANLEQLLQRAEQIRAELESRASIPLRELKKEMPSLEQYGFGPEAEHAESALQELDELNQLMSGGNIRVAMMYINRAIELAPNNSEYLCTRANLLYESGALPKALDQYKAAVKRDADNHEAWFGIAQIHIRKKDKKALETLEKALSINDSIPAYHAARGALLAENPETRSEALTAFDRALELDNQQWEVLLQKARLLELKPDIPGAIESYRRVLLIYPDALEANIRLGLLLEEGNPTVALSYVDRAISQDDRNAGWHAARARILYRTGDSGAVESAAERVLALSDSNEEGYYLLADAFADTLPQQSLEYVLQAITRNPDNPVYYHLAGNLYTSFGRLQDALQAYKTAQELDTGNVEILTRLAQTQFSLEQPACLDTVSTALARAPDYLPARKIRAVILGRGIPGVLDADVDKAIQDLTLTMKSDPDNLELQEMLVTFLEQKKMFFRLFGEKRRLGTLRKQKAAREAAAKLAAQQIEPVSDAPDLQGAGQAE